MIQATHAITVPTSSSTRSPMTAPSALAVVVFRTTAQPLVGSLLLAVVWSCIVFDGAMHELGHVSQNAGHSTAKPWAHNPLSVMFPQLNVLLVSMVQFTCGPVVLIGFDTAAAVECLLYLYCIEVCVIGWRYLGLEILAQNKQVQLVPGCSILYPIVCSDTPPLVHLLCRIHPLVLGLHQCSYLSNITSLIQVHSYVGYL